MTKRTVNAKEILADIKAGMKNHALMEKYQLSEKGLDIPGTPYLIIDKQMEDFMKGVHGKYCIGENPDQKELPKGIEYGAAGLPRNSRFKA